MKVFPTITRLLTFRLTREEMLQLSQKHFIAGLLGTWIVGIGRYWDEDSASTLQHLGLGSVIYIFLLSAFIWIIIKPFFVEDWSYFRVLTFISLTSFPAIIYAIPVEKFIPIDDANSLNVFFLAIVASWRLALLFFFLKRYTRLSVNYIITATLMPICLIITMLTILNLHKVVFNIMGGFRNRTPNDDVYIVLMGLTFLSSVLALPLIVAYVYGIYLRVKKRRIK